MFAKPRQLMRHGEQQCSTWSMSTLLSQWLAELGPCGVLQASSDNVAYLLRLCRSFSERCQTQACTKPAAREGSLVSTSGSTAALPEVWGRGMFEVYAHLLVSSMDMLTSSAMVAAALQQTT
jgi:hypothetical protein